MLIRNKHILLFAAGDNFGRNGNNNNNNNNNNNILDNFTNKKKSSTEKSDDNGFKNNNNGSFDPTVNFDNAAKTLKERFGDLPLPTPRIASENEGGIELPMIHEKQHEPTSASAKPTSMNNNNFDRPFEGLPRDLLDMMPPDIREIANRNPELVKKAMQRSDVNAENNRQTSNAQQQPKPNPNPKKKNHNSPPVVQLSQIKLNSMKKRGYSDRFVGAAAALDMQSGNPNGDNVTDDTFQDKKLHAGLKDEHGFFGLESDEEDNDDKKSLL